jgi:hypothetical protein
VRALALVPLSAVAVVVSACGADERAASPEPTTPTIESVAAPPPTPPPPPPPQAPAVECDPAKAPGYRLCRGDRVTIERRVGGRWRAVARHPRAEVVHGMVQGHWREAWLSPDGRTLLAQWSSECEIPIAFFLPATGGSLRPVTGERDWRTSPESLARGWAPDGRARVLLLQGACAAGHPEPGAYLIDPRTGELERVGPLPERYSY